MDLVRLAHYPFLPEVKEAVREAGPDLGAVLTSPLYDGVRRRARDRIEGSLADGFGPVPILDERSALLELLSVPVARMLAVQLADKTLIARYAASEARLVAQRLQHDLDDDAVTTAAAALGIPVDEGDKTWRMHFSAYIRLAPTHENAWKLIRRPVAKGYLWLDRDDMARLVEEALKRKIQDELEAERGKPMPELVLAALAPIVKAIEPKLEEARENWSQGDFGPVQPQLFPPCIKEVFEALKRSENVPHHGRFAFATFLHTVGWNSEQILDYLSSTPNFDREKSRYQIEHVTGGKSVQAYTPPGCGTMQTNGVCPLAKRDGICFTIKHPLSYYRRQLRFKEREDARAAGAAGASQAGSAAGQPQIAQIPQTPTTEAKP